MSLSVILLIILFIAVVLVILALRFFKGWRFFGKANNEIAPSITKAYYYLAENRPDAALEEFKRIVLKEGGTPETYIIMSVLHRFQGDIDKAAYFCEEALLWRDRKDDIIITSLQELTKIYLIAGKTYNAGNFLTKLPEKFQNLSSVTFIKAEICKERGDFEAAARHYLKYEKQSGKSCGGIIADMYIRQLNNMKDNSRRIKALRAVVKSYPNYAGIRLLFANALFEEGRTAQGLAEIIAVIEKDLIKTKSVLLEIENIFYKYINMDELFNIMSSKIASGSSSPVPYLYVSSYCGKMNDTDRAKEILNRYLNKFRPKVIIAKAYLKLSNDNIMLSWLAGYDDIYRCGVCGFKSGEYTLVCPRCASCDSLDYQ